MNRYLRVLFTLECTSNPQSVPSSNETLKYWVTLLPLVVVFLIPRKSKRLPSSRWLTPSPLFYRHDIPRFAQGTYHLRQLLQKDKKFHLTAQVEAEFNDLIAAFTGSDVLLQYPDWSKPFHVHTDASKLHYQSKLLGHFPVCLPPQCWRTRYGD